MLRFTGPALHACDGFTRRDVLQAGGLSALGLFLPQLTGRAEAMSADSNFGRTKACVVIYLFGGPSQIDTFDLKPDAPVEFRGEFHPIATNVPGVRICEHLPRLARQADKVLSHSKHESSPSAAWVGVVLHVNGPASQSARPGRAADAG